MSEDTDVAEVTHPVGTFYRGNSRHEAFELAADELAARFKESSWHEDWKNSENQLKRDLSDNLRLFILDEKDGLGSTHREKESARAIRGAINLVWAEHKG